MECGVSAITGEDPAGGTDDGSGNFTPTNCPAVYADVQ